MTSRLWLDGLMAAYLQGSLGLLGLTLVVGVGLLGLGWRGEFPSRSTLLLTYGRWVRGVQYGLLLATAALVGAVGSGGGGVHRWVALPLPERYTLLSLGLTELSLFFLLMLYGVLALTGQSFATTPLEEGNRPLSGASTVRSVAERTLLFGLLMALLQLLLLLFFTTENVFLFFVTFEGSVLPIFGVVGFFGKRSQKFRAMAYLLYFTLLSAAPFLGVLLYLYVAGGSAFYPELRAQLLQSAAEGGGLSAGERALAFGALFLPFGVKFSFFPLHS